MTTISHSPAGIISHPITLSDEQAKPHAWDVEKAVDAFVSNKNGDGVSEVSWRNQQLGGCAVLWVKETNGNGHHYQFVPMANLLVRTEIITALNKAEQERIAGSTDSAGNHIPGELEINQAARQELALWPTNRERQDAVARRYRPIADEHKRAINDNNRDIGFHATRLSSPLDSRGRYNAPAKMASTHPLEDSLYRRLDQVDEVGTINQARARRIGNWLLDEIMTVGVARAGLERILVTGDLKAVVDLRLIVSRYGKGKNTHPGLRFITKAAFNQLQYAMQQTGGHLKDPAPIQHALDGLTFHSQQNYLLTPFRKAAGSSGQYTRGDERDKTLQELNERIGTLASMPKDGPYGHLVGRILPLAIDTLVALRFGNQEEMLEAANKSKYLINYLCLPDDPDTEKAVWFRHSF